MKRITALLLAVAFTLGSVVAAQADGIDIKVKGQWDFAFGWVKNRGFKESGNASQTSTRGAATSRDRRRDDDSIEARQRVRTQVNFITSEYLQAVLMFEIGDLDWGRNPGGRTYGRSSGGALDTDGVNIETKRAYLDWIIPNTEVSVRMGLQGLALPATRLGNVVFDADVAGIVISSPVTDWASITGFWIRPFDQYRNDSGQFSFTGNDNYNDEADLFGIVLPLTFDRWSVSPYVMYGRIGANSGMYDYMFNGDYANTVYNENQSANAWWYGANLELNPWEPLVLGVDVIYGRMSRTNVRGFNHVYNSATGVLEDPGFGGGSELSTSGWYIGATLDYKLDWGTPGLFGWWASGDSDNAKDSGRLGRLPVVGTDGGFTATSFGTAGYFGIGNGGNKAVVSNTATGTWGLGIQVADVSFIEDLSHTLRVAYYRGTNSSGLVDRLGHEQNIMPYASDGLYLTTKDSVIEVNFDHTYRIYENLTAVLELGYLHLKTDTDVWQGASSGWEDSDDAWKVELNFRYSF